MTHDELLALINDEIEVCEPECNQHQRINAPLLALRAVVELIKKEQDWLESTKGDMPMTDEWVFRRAERWWLLAKFNFVIDKELA